MVEQVTWVDRMRTKTVLKHEIGRAALAEFVGTLVLVLVITSVCAQNVLPKAGSANALIGVNIGVACGIAFGIALSQRISGGHINPAVTLAFLVLGAIKPIKALAYMAAQVLGAFVGAAITYFLYIDAINVFDAGTRRVEGVKATAHIFASYPGAHLGWFGGLFDQILGTAVFVIIVVHTVDRRNHYPIWVRPFIMGLGFLMVGTAMAFNAGYPLNPARDLGPRLFTLLWGWGAKAFTFNDMGWFWIPIIGPLIGGILGGVLYNFLLGFHTPADGAEYELVTTHELKPISEKIVTHTHTEEHTALNP
jgi:MIP family channel proteins